MPNGGETSLNRVQLLYKLTAANFNVTTDQALTKSWGFATFEIHRIKIRNASGSLTTAAGGFYTGAGKTGVTIVAAGQTYATLTGATLGMEATIAAAGQAILSADPIFALTTAQGSAMTADIYVYGVPLT